MRFSQGFNPHPVFSLACPRPVGVATCDDLAVLTLENPMEAGQLVERMNDCAPEGMFFDKPRIIEGRRTPRPQKIIYELILDSSACAQVTTRLEQLPGMSNWSIERVKISRKNKKQSQRRTIDLKKLVQSITLNDATLQWVCIPQGDLWARVDEVLELIGLDRTSNLSSVVRKVVEYDL